MPFDPSPPNRRDDEPVPRCPLCGEPFAFITSGMAVWMSWVSPAGVPMHYRQPNEWATRIVHIGRRSCWFSLRVVF